MQGSLLASVAGEQGWWEEWVSLGPGGEPAKVTETEMSALLRSAGKAAARRRWADTALGKCMMAIVALGRQLWALTSLSAPEKEQMGFLLALGFAGVAGEGEALSALQKGECERKPRGDSCEG